MGPEEGEKYLKELGTQRWALVVGYLLKKMWLAAWIVCRSLKWFGKMTCTTNRNRNYHRSRPGRKNGYPLLSAEGFATCIESIKRHLRGLSDSTSWNQNWPTRAKFENTRNQWELNLCVNNCKRGKKRGTNLSFASNWLRR